MKKVYILEGSFMDHKEALVDSVEEMYNADPKLLKEIEVIIQAPPQLPSLIASLPDRKRRYNRRKRKPF